MILGYSVAVILILAALVLGFVGVLQSSGKGIVAWAVFLLALALAIR